MDLSFVYAAPVSVASSIAQTVENIVNNPADALLSNASTILLLFAIYSTIKSFSTLVLTPSVCSSAPDSKVAGSRRRLLALHGLNLAVRWGFGVTWLIAKQLQSLGSSTFQPQDLQGLDLKALALRPLEMSLINAPAYRNASFQDMAASNFFQGMLLFDLLMVFFDLGFSNEFWTNLLESSKIPAKTKDVPLSMVYPYADGITRMLALSVDTLAALSTAYFLALMNVLYDQISAFVPRDCHTQFVYLVALYHLVSATHHLVCKELTFGRMLVGTEVMNGDGKPLSFLRAIEREVCRLCFSSFLFAPLLVLMTDESASMVDLISSSREVDTCHSGPVTIDGADTYVKFSESSCVSSKPLSRPSSRANPSKAVPTASPAAVVVKQEKKTPAKTKQAKTPAKTPKNTVKGVVTVVTPPESTKKPTKSAAKSTAKKGKRKADSDEEDEEVPTPKSIKKEKTPRKRAAEVEAMRELYSATKKGKR